MATQLENLDQQIFGATGDLSFLALGNQADPSKSFRDQISPVPSTADSVLPSITIEDSSIARVDRCTVKAGPAGDGFGNVVTSYMLGTTEVFTEKVNDRERVLQVRDHNGKPEGRHTENFDPSDPEHKAISNSRSVFNDDQGQSVIITREGADGKPEIKVADKLIQDPKQIETLLQKEKILFTPPTVVPARELQIPERGGPPT